MNLLLIGCGNLGRLFLQHWAKNPKIKEIWVIEPSLSQMPYFKEYSHIHFVGHSSMVAKNFTPHVVVIAIKPQTIPMALKDYQVYGSAIFISLAAGVSIEALKEYLGSKANIARVMPNIAIKVNESLNLAFSRDKNSLSMAEMLCKNTGNFLPLESEESLDRLTAISGSGPAYFYLLMEGLIKNATEECNIDENTAKMIVRQTFIGSALLLENDPDASPESLRHQISSKKGVTEAVVANLKEPLFLALKHAILQGLKRIGELNHENCSKSRNSIYPG